MSRSRRSSWLVQAGRDVWAFMLREGWLWDWLLAAVLIAINFSIPGQVVKPVHRYLPRHDPGFSYPKVQTWLTGSEKYSLMFALPAVVGALMQVRMRSWLDWHNLMLSVFEGLAVETSFRKWMSLVGRHRPDWDARLHTEDEAAINDGRLSYPSGVAAETFMVCTILFLYLAGKLRLFVHARPGHFALLLLSLLPVGLATFISVTRMSAYHHHFSDLNAGMGLGLLVGTLVYFLNFSSLFEDDANLPRSRSPHDHSSPRALSRRSSSRAAHVKGPPHFARREPFEHYTHVEDVEHGRDQGQGEALHPAASAGSDAPAGAAGGVGGAAGAHQQYGAGAHQQFSAGVPQQYGAGIPRHQHGGAGELEGVEPDEMRAPLLSALSPITGDDRAAMQHGARR